jgi:RNA polymerase sporulation-specific sigma factor
MEPEALSQHLPLVHAALRSLTGSATPRDATDEVMYSGALHGLHLAMERFDPQRGYRFSSFAFPYIRGCALVEEKRNRRHRFDREVQDYDRSSRGIPGVDEREVSEEVHLLLGRLPDRHRMILTGMYLEGQSTRAIASQIGLTPQRVSQLHREALRMMREWIENPAKPPQDILSGEAKKRPNGARIIENGAETGAVAEVRVADAVA